MNTEMKILLNLLNKILLVRTVLIIIILCELFSVTKIVVYLMSTLTYTQWSHCASDRHWQAGQLFKDVFFRKIRYANKFMIIY